MKLQGARGAISREMEFTMVDLGDICRFLRMDVKLSESGYKINQEIYIRQLAEWFGTQLAQPSKVPIDSSLIPGPLFLTEHKRPHIAVSESILV